MEVVLGCEEGFVDLSFAVESRYRTDRGAERVSVGGTHEDERVGFAFILDASWTEVRFEGVPFACYRGSVELIATGTESDRFVHVLDRLYGSRGPISGMRDRVAFLGISLGGDPVDLDAGSVDIKLFFESEDEERYVEVYLNVDVRAGVVVLKEKDPDYRGPLLRALSEEAPSP